MNVSQNSVVAFHYSVSDEEGVQLDSSSGKAPLTYLHGANNIIKGLERALEGKTTGESLQVTIPPEDAYGEHMDALVENVPKDAFGDNQVEVGMRFEAQTNQGPISVVVTEVQDDSVTVDGNHPLAGKSLTFDVTIEDIREATEEEVEHGHVHGEGGHQH